VLRETATIVLASLVANTAALCAFGLGRLIRPDLTFDFGRLVREGQGFLRHGLMDVVWWSAALLALACAVAFVAAVPVRPIGALGRLLRLNRMAGPAGWLERVAAKPIEAKSAWTYAATTKQPDNTCAWIGLELIDDTFVEGVLSSHNPQVTDDSDRSLVLGAPLRIRRHGESLPGFLDADRVVVAAQQIRYMTVSFVTNPVSKEAVSRPESNNSSERRGACEFW
jgi:Family of unknown function (DUF6338)